MKNSRVKNAWFNGRKEGVMRRGSKGREGVTSEEGKKRRAARRKGRRASKKYVYLNL